MRSPLSGDAGSCFWVLPRWCPAGFRPSDTLARTASRIQRGDRYMTDHRRGSWFLYLMVDDSIDRLSVSVSINGPAAQPICSVAHGFTFCRHDRRCLVVRSVEPAVLATAHQWRHPFPIPSSGSCHARDGRLMDGLRRLAAADQGSEDRIRPRRMRVPCPATRNGYVLRNPAQARTVHSRGCR